MYNRYFLCFIVVLFETINALPRYRYRRQINRLKNDDSSVGERVGRFNPISGSIEGTSYYGIGADPNYGSFIPKPNRPNEDILPISYNPDSALYGNLINPNYQQPMLQQQQQNYLYSGVNTWQRPNTNNNYNNPFYNRYVPGSQGWYATGGNYWYNNGQSIIAHPCLLMLSIAILVFCR